MPKSAENRKNVVMKKRIGKKSVGKKPSASQPAEPKPPRLQQVLASAGLGSRRECETLIVEGRVEVDGQTADKLGTRVDPETQTILVDGEHVKVQRPQYFVLNKPVGVVCTSRDPSGRTRVIDLIRADARVYNVGRLDRSSEGMILVTNDGDLANRLTHPSFQIEKRYLVEVAGVPPRETLDELEKGVHLAEGYAKAKSIRPKRTTKRGTILEIVLNEGRNREIRRLLARVGHKVLRLKRIAIGPILLGEMASGESRRLSLDEIAALKGLVKRKKSGSATERKQKELVEQTMLTEFRGRNARRRIRPGADKTPKTRSPGRAVSRQKSTQENSSAIRTPSSRQRTGANRDQGPRRESPSSRSGPPRRESASGTQRPRRESASSTQRPPRRESASSRKGPPRRETTTGRERPPRRGDATGGGPNPRRSQGSRRGPGR